MAQSCNKNSLLKLKFGVNFGLLPAKREQWTHSKFTVYLYCKPPRTVGYLAILITGDFQEIKKSHAYFFNQAEEYFCPKFEFLREIFTYGFIYEITINFWGCSHKSLVGVLFTSLFKGLIEGILCRNCE